MEIYGRLCCNQHSGLHPGILLNFVSLLISRDSCNNSTLFNMNQPPAHLTVAYVITIPDRCLKADFVTIYIMVQNRCNQLCKW